MQYKGTIRALSGIVYLAVIASCAQNPASSGAGPMKQEPSNAVIDLKALGLTLGDGKRLAAEKGYFVTFVKSDGQWRVVGVDTERTIFKDGFDGEALYFSSDLKFAQPDYQKFGILSANEVSKDKTILCIEGTLSALKPFRGYNACRSTLTKAASIAENALIAAVGFPILATGSVPRVVIVDDEKVATLIQQTSALQAVKNKISELNREKEKDLAAQEREKYKNTFARAVSVDQWDDFIRKYTDNDPDRLVPLAIERRAVALKKERDDRSSQAKIVQERIAKVDQFRRSLKLGSETNCGPVVEIKDSLIKVYFPVSNYGNEHWLRREALFPNSYGCRFLNGTWPTQV